MGQETNHDTTLNAAQVNETPKTGTYPLWYCQRCMNMIRPPGAPGSIAADGERYCHACVPFEVGKPPATGRYAATKPSSSRAAMASVALPAAAKSARIRLSTDRLHANEKARPNNLGKFRRKLFFGAAAGAVAAAAILILMSRGDGGDKSKLAGAAKTPVTPPMALKTVILGVNNANDARPVAAAVAKAAPEGAVKVELDEKHLRAEAQARAGGLFASMQEGGVNSNADPKAPTDAQPVANPQNNPIPEQQTIGTAPAKLKLEDFEARFKTFQPLLDAEKYSDAGALLDTLTKDFAKAAWWSEQEKRVNQARDVWREKNDALEQESRDAAGQAQTASQREFLDKLENAWRPKLALGDASAKAAARVVEAVRAARERLGKAEFDKRSEALADAFGKLEKRAATKLPKAELEAALKTAQELKAQMVADPELAEKFCDRWAALNFDLSATRSAESNLFHVDLPGTDPNEVFYDFKNADQVAAWKFEGDGANSGSVEFEDAKQVAVLKVSGEHHFDTKAGKRPPALTLPFYFSAAAWSFEADAAVLKVRARTKMDQSPCFGILITDGGANTVRICVKEAKKNELSIFSRGAGDEKDAVTHLPGKQEDKIRLRIDCKGGRVYMSAANNSKVIDAGRAPFNFEPKFVGLYVETHDKEENASIAFDNVKITGAMDKVKIGAAIDARRTAAINALRGELLKGAKPPLAPLPPKK